MGILIPKEDLKAFKRYDCEIVVDINDSTDKVIWLKLDLDNFSKKFCLKCQT